ncbi:uncharacterized protein LOC128668185 [Microplitis demolitor]|uniref:uncharacterized protein LOC128668185 n=1 Tax=Microplitis demolitor TaxID=69319 RepID=UPI00235B648A|nr:uncharacterized protein LOC128668185 [Microplitis demolitor]
MTLDQSTEEEASVPQTHDQFKQHKKLKPSNNNLDRFNRWKKRKSASESFISDEQEPINNLCEDIQLGVNIKETHNIYDKSVQVSSFENFSDNFVFSCDFDCKSSSVLTQATISSINNLKNYVITKDKSSGPDTPIFLSGFRGYNPIKNDKQLSAITEVTPEVFQLLLNMLPPTGLPFDGIATFFDVDPTCISRIFRDVSSILAQKTKNFIFWSSKEDVQETMPPAFKIHYPNCRVIIDCTEMKCEQPGLVLVRNHMYSDYKLGYTVKFSLGITHPGMISFKSECYGGRSSDPFITNDSNFLKLLEPGDEVMANQGFPDIKKSLDVPNAIIITPPFLHDRHLTEEEIEETYNIASV